MGNVNTILIVEASAPLRTRSHFFAIFHFITKSTHIQIITHTHQGALPHLKMLDFYNICRTINAITTKKTTHNTTHHTVNRSIPAMIVQELPPCCCGCCFCYRCCWIYFTQARSFSFHSPSVCCVCIELKT